MFARVPTTSKTTVLPLIPTENLAEPRLSALTSTSPPVAAAANATTHTRAAAVMLPRPANSCHPLAPVSLNPRYPVNAAKSKVAQLRHHVTPQVSSPIDIYRLELITLIELLFLICLACLRKAHTLVILARVHTGLPLI